MTSIIKETIYIETTIPSYLAARASRDIVVAGHQQLTHEWWQEYKDRYDLFISEAVIQEVLKGDFSASERRMAYLSGLPVLPISREITTLAEQYLTVLSIPPKAALDALHLACCVKHKMDFMLTWNCKHLAHGSVIKRLNEYNIEHRLFLPTIVTPDELMGRDE
ncbi:type II toxin-antitoxin system VapC family toxin [Salicibibacter cibarius]|uniref:Type II toxin-antitoxin system VapC family toxin n=1 Tax=Salicibibacter cibarius TaxID=2743000 RepID=A0A7T6Z501_9BACI|nr:type II toxin-antitoxin system VapC family toxin [Salicibibacter cibarius]QQK76996.1 type II toxin-antitoxin system VapC family toxin [Salicibibacter cibarius]